jgi:hypothetical protein
MIIIPMKIAAGVIGAVVATITMVPVIKESFKLTNNKSAIPSDDLEDDELDID